MESSHRFAVLILAAGASRRMGRNKALLPWGRTTVLEHLQDLWSRAGATQLAVVFDPRQSAMVEELNRLQIAQGIPNPNADEGMMASLRAAADWSGWDSNLDFVIVALVDQPQIPLSVVSDLVDLAASHPGSVTQPRSSNRRGHPIAIPWSAFSSIADSTSQNLREHLHQIDLPRHYLEVSDPADLEDIDTPEDYQRLRARKD